MLQGDPWSQNAGLWPLGERYGIHNFFPATTTSLLALLALWLFLLSFRVLWKLRELMSPKFTQLQLAYLKTFQPQPETIKGEIFGGSFFHHWPVAKCRDGHEFVPYGLQKWVDWTLLEFSKTLVNTKWPHVGILPNIDPTKILTLWKFHHFLDNSSHMNDMKKSLPGTVAPGHVQGLENNVRDSQGQKFIPQQVSNLLGGGFKYFVFSPLFGGNDPIWLIFFKWVETTN